MRLASHPLLSLALLLLAGGGFWASLFGDEDAPAGPVDRDAIAAVLAEDLADPAVRIGDRAPHAATRALYQTAAFEPRWTSARSREAVATLLRGGAADGLLPEEVHLPLVDRRARELAAAHASWTALDLAARDTLADPRPERLAALDLALTDGLFRLGDALLGRRIAPASLYPGVWFPAARDTSRAGWLRLVRAVQLGDAGLVSDALEGLRPPHAGYRRLRARLAALQDDLAPIPAGAPLRPGGRSVRVPHLRDRLTALGYLPADGPDAWARPAPYAYDRAAAGALARFQADRQLAADSVLDARTTDALNADPSELRRLLALNLERWRWLPDDLGERFVWVNLPAHELRVFEHSDSLGGYDQRLQMPANIGNAKTTGWTTPVLSDSIHTLEFQPAWYVPRSLAASNIVPMARRDSLALWRQGVEAYRNGAPVDTRLVPWDSVSVGEFRFVQRPGPANPLGRVKFMMHNPFAILIHDTNKRWSFDDGAGSSMSSGCVQAGAPDELAEYLLTTVNGWKPGAARAAWRGGPRRGVGLERPVRTHFVYFTADTEPDGALRLYPDPYGYDARLAEALGLDAPEAVPEA